MLKTKPQSESGKKSIEDSDFLKCLFEQTWLNARHIEDQRMWFTNIYVIVVAAVLAYLGGIEIDVANVMYMPLVIFLLMFSILSFIIVSKLSSEFESHIRKLKEILNENKPDLEKYAVVPLNRGIWKYLKIRRAFIWFYLLNIALWICLIFLPLIINYAKASTA